MRTAVWKRVAPWVTFFSARVRPLPLLRLIQALPASSTVRSALVRAFDPNTIRKAIDFSFHPKLVDVPVPGGRFRVDVNDHVGFRFYVNNGFEGSVTWFATYLGLGEDDVLLDIGANIGSASIPAAMETHCEVIAVEASKSNASLLLHNAVTNSVRLTPLVYCLVDRDLHESRRWLELSIKNGNTGANSMFDAWNPSVSASSVELARTATLDSLLGDVEWTRIKLAKIDVEGAEDIVLRGARKLLDANIPILFEYRVDALRRYLHGDGQSLTDLLTARFELFGMTDDGASLVRFEPDRPYANAVAIPRSRVREFTALVESGQDTPRDPFPNGRVTGARSGSAPRL